MKKPMLAGTIKDVNDLKFPVLATPKLDGIRCLTIELNGKTVAVSRKLKPIPNEYVRAKVETLGPGFDGELMVRNSNDFGSVSSAIMRRDGKPDFEYCVFDIHDSSSAYIDRLEEMALRLKSYGAILCVFDNGDDVQEELLCGMTGPDGVGVHLCKDCRDKDDCKAPEWVRALIPEDIFDKVGLLAYETKQLKDGHEGVMVRSLDGPYKEGRSTVREGYLLKLKRFEDDEARVIGVIEELHNENEATVDNLGRTKRSSHKANKTGKGSMGALRCTRLRDGKEFKIGTGFTAEQREELWLEREDVLGRIVKYKSQAVGAQEKPRFPSFLGFRHKDDM